MIHRKDAAKEFMKTMDEVKPMTKLKALLEQKPVKFWTSGVDFENYSLPISGTCTAFLTNCLSEKPSEESLLVCDAAYASRLRDELERCVTELARIHLQCCATKINSWAETRAEIQKKIESIEIVNDAIEHVYNKLLGGGE